MNRIKSQKETAGFVELPTGIFTADGIWFHTTEAALREFADEVVERVGVGRLVLDAGTWLRSADAAGAVALALLLLALSAPVALMATLLIYLFWDSFAPAFVFISVIRLFKVFSAAAFQGVLYVVVISWLGMGGEYLAVVVGLAGFILLRWGLMRKAVGMLSRSKAAVETNLPPQDRILRTLVLRYAVSMRITVPSTQEFERRILEIWQRRNRNV